MRQLALHYDEAMTFARAIAAGGLAVGALDAADAIIFYGVRGVAPIRIFQSIAGGLLGPSAFQRGLTSAALGVVLHFTIAGTIVTVLCVIARRWPGVIRHTFVAAAVYGVSVWIVMNYAVIPLSAASRGRLTGAVLVNGLLIHIFGVGLPAVLAARAAARADVRTGKIK